jgi:hypothetical protein
MRLLLLSCQQSSRYSYINCTSYIKVLLKNEMRIMGSQEGILAKPHVMYPKGMARWYCCMIPLNGWKGPSYGVISSILFLRTSSLNVSAVVVVRFRAL